MLEDEHNLVARAKEGEAEAFGLLYDFYMPRIYRFVLFKVGHREEAEDLTHQVFLKAWENVEKYVCFLFIQCLRILANCTTILCV